MYIENPKCKGSGILGAIPQEGLCPIKCKDCFFQGGRSYLQKPGSNDPEDMLLPNLPEYPKKWQIIRVNDGNDSNNQKDLVINTVKSMGYDRYFYNTSIPDLDKFDGPVVLTVNPCGMTDLSWHKLEDIPSNLMMIRIRVNTWNLVMVRSIVQYYASKKIPCIYTFMAYNDSIEDIPEDHRDNYFISRRTLNKYAVIKTEVWRKILMYFQGSKYEEFVYTCSKIEGHENASRSCSRCGNCVREYMNTMERIDKDK